MKFANVLLILIACVLAGGAISIGYEADRVVVLELPAREAPDHRLEPSPTPLAAAVLAIYWKAPLYPYADRYELWFGEADENGVMLTDGYAVVYMPGGDPPMEGVPLQPGDEIHENGTAIWFVRP